MLVADPAAVDAPGSGVLSQGDGRRRFWPRPGFGGCEVGRFVAGRRGAGDRPAMFEVPGLCVFASLVNALRARLD